MDERIGKMDKKMDQNFKEVFKILSRLDEGADKPNRK